MRPGKRELVNTLGGVTKGVGTNKASATIISDDLRIIDLHFEYAITSPEFTENLDTRSTRAAQRQGRNARESGPGVLSN